MVKNVNFIIAENYLVLMLSCMVNSAYRVVIKAILKYEIALLVVKNDFLINRKVISKCFHRFTKKVAKM